MTICSVCPHNCELATDEVGICGIYKNSSGRVTNLSSNKVSALMVDAIEKRPFFHFLPGKNFLSIGWYGCQFSCKFCFNFQVSQSSDGPSKDLSPSKLAKLAASKDVAGIAFTYNEPLLYYEYILELSKQYSPIVVKTNGFIARSVLAEVCNNIAAINIDIKGDEAEYQRICGGTLEPVLSAIEYCLHADVHLEISYLVLPRMISDYEFHNRVRGLLSESTPLHLLFYYPFYKMDEPTYSDSELIKLHGFFKEKIHHVYISNKFSAECAGLRNSYCPECGSVMISREGKVKINSTSCCGGKLHGKFV